MCERDLPDTIVNGAFGVDPCISDIAQALVDADLATIASCCGHGTSLGRVSLVDGRELLIAPDYETATRLWVRVDEGEVA